VKYAGFAVTPVEAAAMSAHTIVIADWQALRRSARAIRWEVFILEQNVPVELEWDEHDAASLHAVVFAADGTPLATGRLLPDGHIGRMAVLKVARGTGIGGALLKALLERAVALGYPEAMLNAQTAAETFYARYGFAAEGEVFMEAGIPHRVMRKRL